MNRADRRARAKHAGKPDPLTVLWHSNAPWSGTGYGTQTKQVVERMARDGHAVAVNANYGLQATKMVWEGIPIYPMGMEHVQQRHGARQLQVMDSRKPRQPCALFRPV
jgi:hypothetical protein